jgi:hypothetical protein
MRSLGFLIVLLALAMVSLATTVAVASSHHAQVHQTAIHRNQRLERLAPIRSQKRDGAFNSTISIFADQKLQELVGFGGGQWCHHIGLLWSAL